ncbi:anthranilate synthase component I family protein [Acinetobacter pseudolwoffii]|uniref:anthranilate synthase component I family protein n=1 Tax=Acinetobacter pseudolwoffii TaxID=2053287 RepID=UPI0025790B07|nr:anthranilate synthase component I family protein [Acinetobacter pseudolwoffii]MDM1341807.1 anthranilate synthase component I family protein [Acinetobacter pseudolwoffii]
MTEALYHRPLKFESRLVADLLSALKTLDHLVYLNNNGQPFIACCAQEYFVAQTSQIQSFKRTGIEQYQPSPSEFNLAIDALKNLQKNGFHGGYVGFIGYDYAAQQYIQYPDRSQPGLVIGQFSSYIKPSSEGWMFYSDDPEAEQIFNYIQNLLNQNKIRPTFQLISPCTSRWTKTVYSKAFQKIQDYIIAGDCYQINLTQEFNGRAQGSLLATAQAFWTLTEAPYAGYLRIGDFELLSCSPELFIDFETKRKIITKPIKGTMPRFTDPVLDEQSRQTLKASEKDQAENVMIVDLLRNDLSVYAETGSVKTPKLFSIESFNQVHHMVSEVEATLKANINPFEVLMSALPGGSITGAPKIRAMQIIEELEGTPRGAYCGSMGYFNFDGTGSWNILIRSIQKYQEDISLWAGGGITISSDCDAEYQECFDKVSAMLDLLNTWYQPE